MASPISALSNSNTTAASNASSSAGLGGSAPSQEVFLQLLVSQIKNQDPLNPTDSTTFVSQLAQFSELEQVIAIRGDLDAAKASGATQNTTPTPTSATSPLNSTSNTQSTNQTGQTNSTGQTQP
jgi:flagellar basal-body rod modification protein FlgD